jgi:hypothetical protein
MDSWCPEDEMMCLGKICRVVQIEVRDLGTYLWEEDRPAFDKQFRKELEVDCQRLAASIQGGRNLAKRCHAGLVELERRLARHETEAADLLKRAKIYHRLGDRANAWSCSLALEQLRQVVLDERSRVNAQETAYRNQLAQLKRLRLRLAELQG